MDAKAEAMTLIIWDRPRKEVETLLLKAGYPADETTRLINNMMQRRHQLVRKKALRNLLLGALIGTASLGRIMLTLSDSGAVSWFRGPVPGLALGALILGAIWGPWWVIEACFNLARPERVRGDLGHHEESF